MREYLPRADHEAENRIVERSEMEDLEGVIPLPGARKLLASLPGDRWTIVTSSTRPLAEVRLRAAGLLIPRKLVTSSEVTNGKPHPEPYLKAAAALGYAATECVVVEDAPAGIRAGKAAGAKVIAFPTTCDLNSLWDAGANWLIENCSQISVIEKEPELRLQLVDSK